MKLPSSFTDYTRALLGVEEYEKLAAALEGEQPVSIRMKINYRNLHSVFFVPLLGMSLGLLPDTIWTSG